MRTTTRTGAAAFLASFLTNALNSPRGLGLLKASVMRGCAAYMSPKGRLQARNRRPQTSTYLLCGTLLVLAGLLAAAEGDPVDLEVTLEGVHSADGQVLVALHRRAPGVDFPSDEGVVARKRLPADTEPVVVRFRDLAPGDYAVAAIHDADDDGELNANVLGMPTEGYGFSNGARGLMGPPSFEAAAVTIAPAEGPHRIVVPIKCPGSAR